MIIVSLPSIYDVGLPGIFSQTGKNSLSLKQLPGPGKYPGEAETVIVANYG